MIGNSIIKVNSIWRKTPQDSAGVIWGGMKVVVAVTNEYVVIRNEFVSTLSPELNKEDVIPVADFLREYVTKEEAARRIEKVANEVIYRYTAKLDKTKVTAGNPILIERTTYSETWEFFNRVRLRFVDNGHFYVVPNDTGNPISTYDIEWIKNKSLEMRKASQAFQIRSYTYDPYYYNRSSTIRFW